MDVSSVFEQNVFWSYLTYQRQQERVAIGAARRALEEE
jgi:hypothetical protein